MNMFTQLLEDTEVLLSKKEDMEKQKTRLNERKLEVLTLAEKIRDTKLDYPSSSSTDDAFEMLSMANNREVTLKNIKAWREQLETLQAEEEKDESLDTILGKVSSLALTEKLLIHRWLYYFKAQKRRVFGLGKASSVQTERRVLSWLFLQDMDFEVITEEKRMVIPRTAVVAVAGMGILAALTCLRQFCSRKT